MAIQFYMRGYNTVAHVGAPIGYVDWVVNDVPDSSATFVTTVNANYVPGEITNITVNRIVQSKVDNFLKPEEGNVPLGPDSYWLHVNAYDWLNRSPLTLPPNPAISVPPQITGLAIVRGTVTGTTPRDFSTLFWDESNQTWKFAFNTNGDGFTVGALQDVALNALNMNGPLTIGTPASHTGLIRITNNQADATGNTGAIKARNTNDTGDITLILADNGNRVQIGSASDPVHVPSTIRVDTAVVHGLDATSTSVAQTGFIRDQNNTNIVVARNFLTTGDLTLLSTDTSDRIVHGAAGLNKGQIFNISTGSTTTIAAGSNNVSLPTATINVASTTGFPNAGIIKVATGAGTQIVTYTGLSGGTQFTGCTGGIGTMLTGNNVTAYIFNDFQVSGTSQVQIAPANITYASGISSPTISQFPNTSNTVTGQALTVQAQNAIGQTTTGGSLNLTSGTSTTTVITAASNGASLPTATINVASTTGFPTAGQIAIVSSAGLQLVQYTGTTATTFTGCTLGTGTLSTGNNVTLSASAGNVNLQTGGYSRLSVSPTTVTSADPLVTFTNSFVSTTIAAGSNGAVLPQATINVVSTNGFPTSGVINVATAAGQQTVSYTGTTATTFTGCTGGTFASTPSPTLSTGGAVSAAPLIQQTSVGTSSATGETLTVQAQNATGTTSTGGNLALTSGSGTTVAGYTIVQTGGVNQIIVSPTNLAAQTFPTTTGKVIILGNLEVQGTTTTVDSTVVDIIGRIIHANWSDPAISPNVAVPSQITGYSIHRGNASGVPRDSAAWIWTEGALNSGADGYWRALTTVGDGYGTDGYTASNSLNNLGVMGNNFSATVDPNPPSGTLPGVGGLRAINNASAVVARNVTPTTTIAATSNLASLPQATINVASTTGFTTAGTLLIFSDSGQQTVTYTGTGATTFTGASGGAGTLHTGNWVAQTNKSTTIAAGSNNVALPTGTINVASTSGFPSSGTIRVVTTGGVQNVNYTGLSGGTQFTGCTLGTGTMLTGNSVSSPPVSGNNDLILLGTDFGNRILHGAPTINTGHIFNTSASTNYDFQVNSISQVVIGAIDTNADGYIESISIGPTVNSPRISQTTQPDTGANAGFPFVIQAQAGQQQTGATANNNGGKLVLASGSAGSGGSGAPAVHGTVDIQTDAVLKMRIFPTFAAAASDSNTLFIDEGIIRISPSQNVPLIRQDSTTNASGQSLTLQAQNAATRGGPLLLQSGTGPGSLDGYVNILTGTTTKATFFPTFAISAADNNSILLFENKLRFDVAQSVPLIRQDDQTTNATNGQSLTLQAQNSTGTTTVGGPLLLQAGTGTSNDGYINLITGSTVKMTIFPTTAVSAANNNSIQLFENKLRFDTAQTTPLIRQDDKTANGGTGETFTLQAQNETGTTSTGGSLNLASGSGTSANGAINLLVGGTQTIAFNSVDTDASGFSEVIAIASTITAPRIFQVATGGASGTILALMAQNATTTGGPLQLHSGTGATNDGYINLTTGTTVKMTIYPTTATVAANNNSIQLFENKLRFDTAQTTPLIRHDDKTTNAGTGETLTVQAQNETGTTSTGGALVLTSGTGTTVAGNVNIQTGGTTRVSVNPTFTTFSDASEAYRITPVSAGATTLQAINTATSVTYKQGDLTTNAGTGAATTIQAQNETGTTSTGGALVLTSGTGTTVAGNVNIQTGAVTRVSVNPTFTTFNDTSEAYRITPVSAGATTLQAINTATSVTYKQGDLTTNAGTGATTTLQAQNETGTTSTGGALVLTSGTGTTTAGNTNIQTGGVTRVAVNPTFTTFNDAAEAFRITPVSAGTTTLQFATGVTAATLFQADKTTNAGTGATLTVQAQNETGTTSTGGALTLTSGTGTTTAGNVNIQTGAVTRVAVNPTFTTFNDTSEAYRITPVSAGATTLQAINTATSVTYKQGDLTTASGTGATTTIQAQNETGTTSTGGALTLTSGTGTTTNGAVNLQVGGVTTASLVTSKFVFNKGRRRNVTAVSTTYQVLISDDYIAVTASTVYTITLPATPTTGDTYEFKDINGTSGTNTITIAGNGNNIDGAASTTLNANYTSLVVTYTGAQWSVS